MVQNQNKEERVLIISHTTKNKEVDRKNVKYEEKNISDEYYELFEVNVGTGTIRYTMIYTTKIK